METQTVQVKHYHSIQPVQHSPVFSFITFESCLNAFQFPSSQMDLPTCIVEVGKLWPVGHIQPAVLFNVACWVFKNCSRLHGPTLWPQTWGLFLCSICIIDAGLELSLLQVAGGAFETLSVSSTGCLSKALFSLHFALGLLFVICLEECLSAESDEMVTESLFETGV